MSNSNASTVSQEKARTSAQKGGRVAGRSLQQKLGTVSEVHPDLPMIKVTFSDGSIAAGNKWIGVGHSVLDIAHRFGSLRVGLRVLITFSGEVEINAIATIVGVEDELLGDEIQHPNTFNSNFPWEIATPGSL